MYSESSIAETTYPPSLVADDRQSYLQTALVNLAQRTHFPIVFGGFAEQNHVVVSLLLGNRRDSLRGLEVRTGWGLGGRVLQEARPRLTSDYGASRVITHDYDVPVLAEGITSLLAIPVTVGTTVAAVLYGGLRTSLSVGDVSIEPATAVARELATALSRMPHTLGTATTPDQQPSAGDAEGSARAEALRKIFADVRGIKNRLTDPELRADLTGVEDRITALVSGSADPRSDDGTGRTLLLTPREVDVLSLVALGCSNATIGRTLGVTVPTVKSYMNAAMRKLDAETRYEAVACARRLRLLP